jgi:hypothetical protein
MSYTYDFLTDNRPMIMNCDIKLFLQYLFCYGQLKKICIRAMEVTFRLIFRD